MQPLDVVLGRIDSMDEGSAAADAAELHRILKAARAIADRLEAAFASVNALEGDGVVGAQAAGARLGTQITAAADRLEPAAHAMTNAAGDLAAAQKARAHVSLLSRVLNPSTGEDEVRRRIVVANTMNTVYSDPMSGRADGVQTIGGADSSARGASVGAPTVPAPGGGGVGVHSAEAVTPATPASTASSPGGSTPATAVGPSTVTDQTPLGAPAGPVPGAAGPGSAAPGPLAPPTGSGGSPGTQVGGSVRSAAGSGGAPPSGGSSPPGPVGGVGTAPLAVSGPGGRSAGPPGTVPTIGCPGTQTAQGPTRPGAGVPSGRPSAVPPGLPGTAAGQVAPGSSGPGRGGTSAMMPPGGARGAREDETRKRPGYLLSATECVSMIGPLPEAGPAVIGEPPAVVADTAPTSGDARTDDDQELDPTL